MVPSRTQGSEDSRRYHHIVVIPQALPALPDAAAVCAERMRLAHNALVAMVLILGEQRLELGELEELLAAQQTKRGQSRPYTD